MADKKHRMSVPATGGSSLLVVFAVLALTVFALLSLSGALADKRLSDAAVESVVAYYEADALAEEIFAQLRNGDLPDGVREETGRYFYTCPISETQSLQVVLQYESKTWTVLRWQAVSSATQTEEDNLLVWDGEEMD